MRNDSKKYVYLRQDVDRLPENSLVFAHVQHELGIKSTFYFRSVSQSFQTVIIKEISRLGHEIGYHYEDLSLAAQRLKTEDGRRKDIADGTEQWAQSVRLRDINMEHETRNPEQFFELAIESFEKNLEKLREYADVKTICMHGSPMSKWDSRLLWKYYDYREFGVECEPYFYINFENMLYLTDTGRRWNGCAFSVRDKAGSRWQGSGKAEEIESRQSAVDNQQKISNKRSGPYDDWKVKPVPGSMMNMTHKSTEFQTRYNFRTTNDIIRASKRCKLPDKIMMTFHPQRWTDKPIPWVRELIWQNTKNVGKYFLIKIRK